MTSFNPHQLRPYHEGRDLDKILQFVGECNLLTDFCGYLHPGDISHFMSNTLRGRDLAQHIYVYEHEEVLLAIVLLYPARFAAYEVLVHPHYRAGELEASLLAWGEQQAWTLMQMANSTEGGPGCDVMNCDTIRRNLLLARGYVAGADPAFCYTTRSLEEPLPVVTLPEGFVIRSVAGEHVVDALCAVHNAAFGSSWQPAEYLRVMRTPGFHRERELVVVAPDGRFAAFLIYWLDPISKSGLFEPVGCHEDFRQRGLTSALMYEGMRCMLAYGMTMAVVIHQAPAKNPAAAALYRSTGFNIRYTLTEFRKLM